MKKFLKSAGLPIGVFALAIGSAFATNAMKNAEMQTTDRVGYIQLDNNMYHCEIKNVTCSTSGIEICTWRDAVTNQDIQLYELDSTDPAATFCSTKLFKKQ